MRDLPGPDRTECGRCGLTGRVFDWPLPAEAHVPGDNRRPPDDDDVHRIAGAAPAKTTAQAWRSNEAYLAGHRLHGNGFHWEAHEVWEPVWMHAVPNSPERDLLRGLIQMANAALKLKMQRPAAARRLFEMAAIHLRDARSGGGRSQMGLDLDALITGLERQSGEAARLELSES